MKSSLIFTITLLLIIFGSCKKSIDPSAEYVDNRKFSFTYNGVVYNDRYLGFGIGRSFDGITINHPNLFKGIIYYHFPKCAYLEPIGYQVSGISTDSWGCNISFNIPPDSAKLFFYQNGEANFSYNSCVTKSSPDFVFGGFIEYQVCTVSGTFDLTLKNKFDSIIHVSGSFVFPNIRK